MNLKRSEQVPVPLSMDFKKTGAFAFAGALAWALLGVRTTLLMGTGGIADVVKESEGSSDLEMCEDVQGCEWMHSEGFRCFIN